jgi:hypothetical protein
MIYFASFSGAETEPWFSDEGSESALAELTKLGEMYAGLTRNAYKPVEQAAAKATVTHRRSA